MRPRAWLFFTLAAFVALAALYSVTTPIFEAPDEVWHYAYIRQLALGHALPVVDAEGKAPYRHEGLQPPLYYAAGAPLIAWIDGRELAALPPPNPFARIGDPQASSNDNRNAFLHTADEGWPYRGTALAVHLLRLYSILLAAGTVLLTYALGREVFPDTPIFALGATLLAAFLPQFLFISSAINNDNLATLLSVAVLWQLARVLRRGLTRARSLTLGLLVAAGLLTKLNTIALLGLVFLVVLYTAVQKREARLAVGHMAFIAGLVAALAGGWYVRNWMLYDDLTTWARLVILVGERVQPLSFWRWLSLEGEGLLLSLWGVFGWFNIRASPEFYTFYDGLAAVGVIGILAAFMTRRSLSLRLALLPLWCAFVLVALWGYASIVITSQGRLLFPALPAAAVLWSWGLFSWVPARWQSGVAALLGAGLAAVAVWAPIALIAPAYRPTVVAENALPSNLSRLNWRFENGVEFVGASVERKTVKPGESLAVTLYARAPAGSTGGEALFIHLINSAEVIVAQRDSLLGSGNLTASPAPAILADTYTLSIPLTAPAPDEWQIRLGLYDRASGRRLAATGPAGRSLGDAPTLTTLAAQAADGWNYDLDGRAVLVGADLDRSVSLDRGLLVLTLYWGNSTAAFKQDRVFVHVLGSSDRIWAGQEAALDTSHPTRFELQFDPETPSGVYPIELGIYGPPNGDRRVIYDRRGQPIGDQLFLGPIRVMGR